jgi:cyclophilin family peptidyl-prolyl cis-trans isomerase
MATDLTPIQDVTLYAGAPLNIALDGIDTEGDAISYTVTTSNSLLATSVIQGNHSLKMSVQGYGDMIFELFEQEAPLTTARIMALAQNGTYNGLTFHRIIKDFMIQGGDPAGTGSGGTGVKFDDEFNPNLQFTSSGILAMAKSADDTNDCQFFITSKDTRWLDYNHSIFGFLTEGDSVREQIESVAVGTDGSTPTSQVKINSVSVIVDQENGVLRLSAPAGTTGETTVTVAARDATGATVTRSFKVTIKADTTNNFPYLGSVNTIQTNGTSPVTINIPATDVEGDAILYYAGVLNSNPNLTVSYNSSTGATTITPNGTPGIYGIQLGVRAQTPGYTVSDYWDTQTVPVYVNPVKPTLTLLSDTGASDGITSLNNTAGKKLQFRVSGLNNNTVVTLYADGQVVPYTVISRDNGVMTLETDGSSQLAEGQHAFTVIQKTANQAADIGNQHISTTLTSPTSDVLTVQVDTTAPQITSTAVLQALEGRQYLYDVNSNEEAGGHVTYSLVQTPAGMQIPDPRNGQIVWTPGPGLGSTQRVVVRATDGAGNYVDQSFDVTVTPAARILPINDQTVQEGATLTLQVQTEADSSLLPLTFRLASGPAGATIDSTTGVFTWTPSETQGPEQYAVTVEVTTQAGTVSTRTFQVTVGEVNQAPTLNAIIDRAIDEHQLLEFDVVASDLDLPANRLVFSLLDAPEGAFIDPLTGRFNWRPSEAQGGRDFSMTIRVTDSAGASDERTFTIRVNEIQAPPQFEPVQIGTASPGDTFEFDVRATDPDLPARAIRYSLEPGAPDGASVDPVTGHVTWNVPENLAAQKVVFAVRATEVAPAGQQALSVVQQIEVTVFDYRLAMLDTVLRDLAPSVEGLLRNGPQSPLEPRVNATIARPAASPAVATPSGTLLNRGQLFGRNLISGRSSSGNSVLLSPDDKGDKSDKKREDSQRDGKQNAPVDTQSPTPAGEEKAGRRRQTSQNDPEVHDLVVQALADEVESLIMSDSEESAEPSTELSAATASAPETGEQVAVEEVGTVAAE